MIKPSVPRATRSNPFGTAYGYRSVPDLAQEVAAPKALIAILDDDPTTLRGVARLLTIHGFDVKPFSSPCSLLTEIESLRPACLIADLWMPDLTGFDVQRTLAERGLSCPVVFLTGGGDIRLSVQAMRDGAVDFLTKPFEQDDLLCAVGRAVTRSGVCREQAERLADARKRCASLTERERQVFEQVVSGLLNKQVAGNLGIAEKTVKVHRARVMRKMGAKSLAQLVRIAGQLRTHETAN